MSVSRRGVIGIILPVVVMLSLTSARAVTTYVPVTLTVKVEGLVPYTCRLSVPYGSNGVNLLRAATTSGCITSYTLYRGSTATWIDCIRRGRFWHQCEFYTGVVVYAFGFWYLAENGKDMTPHGLEALHADAGDSFLFSYFAACCYG